MVGPALAMLLFGATVSLRIEDAAGVDAELARDLGDELAREIERRLGDRVVVRGPSGCGADDRCLDGVRQADGADELILAGFFGGLTKVRMIVERITFPGRAARVTVEAEGSREAGSWRAEVERVAGKLFPEQPFRSPPAAAIPDPAGPRAPVESRVEAVPWIVAGLAVAALAAAAAFGAGSLAAKGDIDSAPHTRAELEDLTSRARGQAVAAGVCLGAAAVLTIAGAAIAVE